MNFKTDMLIKVGGSLMGPTNEFYQLVETLEKISVNHNLVITTGSKALSDVMMNYLQAELGIDLNLNTRFNVIMAARDSIARVFSDFSDLFYATDDVDGIYYAFSINHIPVLLQHNLFIKHNPFPIEKGLSTDTTSAFFASYLGAAKFIKLTNVAGIYRRINVDSSPIEKISARDLGELGTTCVDNKLGLYLPQLGIDCYVMNGNDTENLRNFVEGKPSLYTHIEH